MGLLEMEIGELIEENQRLKKQIQREREEETSRSKMSDLATALIFTAIYWVSIRFLLDFAWLGLKNEIGLYSETGATVLFVSAAFATMVLYVAGTVAPLLMIGMLYSDEIRSFLRKFMYAFSSAVSSFDEPDEDYGWDDDAEYFTEEDLFGEFAPEKPKKVKRKPRKPTNQPRTKDGKFAPKKTEVPNAGPDTGSTGT